MSWKNRFSSPEVLGGAVVVGGTVLVSALGLAEVPVVWILLGTSALTIVGILVGNAVKPGVSDRSQARALGGAVAMLLLVLVGVAGYIRWWDPARTQGTRVWELVLVDADETQCLSPSGEPGGEGLLLDPLSDRPLAPVCGRATHLFECRSRADDRSTWLRLAGTQRWLPEANLRPRVGSTTAGIPNC